MEILPFQCRFHWRRRIRYHCRQFRSSFSTKPLESPSPICWLDPPSFSKCCTRIRKAVTNHHRLRHLILSTEFAHRRHRRKSRHLQQKNHRRERKESLWRGNLRRSRSLCRKMIDKTRTTESKIIVWRCWSVSNDDDGDFASSGRLLVVVERACVGVDPGVRVLRGNQLNFIRGICKTKNQSRMVQGRQMKSSSWTAKFNYAKYTITYQPLISKIK